jgi:hypothetical protein
MYMKKGVLVADETKVEMSRVLTGHSRVFKTCGASYHCCSSPAFSGLPESHKAQRENLENKHKEEASHTARTTE